MRKYFVVFLLVAFGIFFAYYSEFRSEQPEKKFVNLLESPNWIFEAKDEGKPDNISEIFINGGALYSISGQAAWSGERIHKINLTNGKELDLLDYYSADNLNNDSLIARRRYDQTLLVDLHTKEETLLEAVNTPSRFYAVKHGSIVKVTGGNKLSMLLLDKGKWKDAWEATIGDEGTTIYGVLFANGKIIIDSVVVKLDDFYKDKYDKCKKENKGVFSIIACDDIGYINKTRQLRCFSR